jgi:hypothetical protein
MDLRLQKKKVPRILWKTWMGQVDLSRLPWIEGSPHRNLSCHIEGSRYKEIIRLKERNV